MRLKITEVSNNKVWDNFAFKFRPNNFLTSWNWSEFNQAMGDKPFRLGLYEGKNLVGICLAIKTTSKKGNFLLCQAGPLLKKQEKRFWIAFITYLKALAKDENLKFIRLRPLLDNNNKNNKFLDSLNFHYAPAPAPAQDTLILNLDQTPDDLLAAMRKTTRYLIRKADKEGVSITISTKLEDLKYYFKLEENTVAKHNFTPFSKKYIQNQFLSFQKTNDAIILLGKYKGKVISTAVVTFYGDCAFYNHGASIDTKIPGSYAVQWEAILESKRRSKKYYNFWGGMAPENEPNHPWAGIALFKTGFGGIRQETVHARDIPLSITYKPIATFERIRRKLRGHSSKNP